MPPPPSLQNRAHLSPLFTLLDEAPPGNLFLTEDLSGFLSLGIW